MENAHSCKHYLKGNKCGAPKENRCHVLTRKVRIYTKCLLRRRPNPIPCGQYEPIKIGKEIK